MIYKTRKDETGATKLELYDDNGEYVRLVAEFMYDNEGEAVCDALNEKRVVFPDLLTKVAQEVIEAHSGALEKLDDKNYWKHPRQHCVAYKEGGIGCPDCYDSEHTPECKWHKDWHACDCGAFDKPDEDVLDDEEEALLNRLCDAIETECFGEDTDYERKRMKKTLQRILDGEREL